MKLKLALTLILGALVSSLAFAQKKDPLARDLSGCAGPGFSLVKVIQPSVDFAELRSTRRPNEQLEKVGTACRTAKKPAACREKLAKATSTRGWNDGGQGRSASENYLVITRGDEVKVVTTAEEFVAAVGKIDTAAKAGAIGFITRGIMPVCGGSVRQLEGGFEVFLQTDSCFGPAKELLKVDVKGTVTLLSSEQQPGTCMG